MTRGPVRVLGAIVACAAACASAPDPLYEAFKTPAADARPFVRWRWNGGRIEKKELHRQLEVLREAGFGGVEVHPTPMPPGVPDDPARPAHAWLSGDWGRQLRAAVDGARERGMVTDLAVGPRGRLALPVLAEDEQIQRVRVLRIPFDGPLDTELRVKTLEAELPRTGAVTARRLLFARIGPTQRQAFTPGTDLQLKAGTEDLLRLELAAGKHELYVGFLEIGFMRVGLGPPDAEAPIVDHLNVAAVRRALDEVAKGVQAALGGRLADSVRAVAVQPVDLGTANWTSDLPAEFAKRRGYDLMAYLPYLFNERDGYGDTSFAETIRRARHDYARTMVELYRERFVATYAGWCKQHGVRARVAGDGREAYPYAASDGFDLPDGRTLLVNRPGEERLQVAPALLDRYLAGISRQSGHRRFGFEIASATTTFRETLDELKLAVDAAAASGLAHPLLDGFDYAPAAAPFPGWVGGGLFLHEKCPSWPHMRRWTDYAGRVTALFREAWPADGQVAIVTAQAETWARQGLTAPASAGARHAIADALLANGVEVDFVDPDLLATGSVDGNRVRVGGRTYDLVLLDNVEALPPSVAEALLGVARAGAKLAFVGRRPRKSPGLLGAAANDRKVADAMHAIFALALPFATIVDPPPARDLAPWAAALQRRFELKPATTIVAPDSKLMFSRGTVGPRPVYFFANNSRRVPLSTMVIFPTGKLIPWRWDPETGRRSPEPVGYYPDQVRVQLGPAESVVLVFDKEPGTGTIEARPDPSERDVYGLQPTWTVDLQHVYPPRSGKRDLPVLADLGKSRDDLLLGTFAGTLIYRATFEAPDDSRPLLHLGTVHGTSQVKLNGVDLGVRWYGEHVYDAGAALRAGKNDVEIAVTTPVTNYLRAIGDVNPVARHWTRGLPPASVGLIGPLELRARREGE